MSRDARKQVSGFLIRSDKNGSVQSQKKARGCQVILDAGSRGIVLSE